MKKILNILILLIGFAGIKAQQTPLFTQYMFNPLVYNPAVAGTNNYYQIRMNGRLQWVGFNGAPTTYCLSVYGPQASKKYDMGYGGYVMEDVTGPTSNLSFMGTYGYNIALNDEIRMSMGLALGMLQKKIDGTQTKMFDQNDPTFNPTMISTAYAPDGNIGAYVYSSNFNVGLAATQLFNNSVKFSGQGVLDKLRTHFNLTGSYKYYIDRDFAVEPSLLIQAVDPAPIQINLSARAIYKTMVWLGLAYRSGDAISVLIGYNYQNKYYIGYSYDIGISGIQKYQQGSHEIMISYRFSPIK